MKSISLNGDRRYFRLNDDFLRNIDPMKMTLHQMRMHFYLMLPETVKFEDAQKIELKHDEMKSLIPNKSMFYKTIKFFEDNNMISKEKPRSTIYIINPEFLNRNIIPLSKNKS